MLCVSRYSHKFFSGFQRVAVLQKDEKTTQSVFKISLRKTNIWNLIPRDFRSFFRCYRTDLFVVSVDIVYLHNIQELFQQLFDAIVAHCYLFEGTECWKTEGLREMFCLTAKKMWGTEDYRTGLGDLCKFCGAVSVSSPTNL